MHDLGGTGVCSCSGPYRRRAAFARARRTRLMAARPDRDDLLRISERHVGLRQAGQTERARQLEEDHQQRSARCRKTVIHDPYRRHHPSVEGQGSTTPSASSRRPGSTCITCRRSHDIIERWRSKSTGTATALEPRAGRLVFVRRPAACTSSASSMFANPQGRRPRPARPTTAECCEDEPSRANRNHARVLFAHIPLWTVYSESGAGAPRMAPPRSTTSRFWLGDGAQRTLHQVMQKARQRHLNTARSTRFRSESPAPPPRPDR